MTTAGCGPPPAGRVSTPCSEADSNMNWSSSSTQLAPGRGASVVEVVGIAPDGDVDDVVDPSPPHEASIKATTPKPTLIRLTSVIVQ